MGFTHTYEEQLQQSKDIQIDFRLPTEVKNLDSKEVNDALRRFVFYAMAIKDNQEPAMTIHNREFYQISPQTFSLFNSDLTEEKAKEYYNLGEKCFIDGFDKHLVGMKITFHFEDGSKYEVISTLFVGSFVCDNERFVDIPEHCELKGELDKEMIAFLKREYEEG